MAAETWDPEGDARRALRTAVDDAGLRALSDPQLLDNLLRDLLPELPREASLIVAAAQVDVAAQLVQQVNSQVDTETAIRLAVTALANGRAFDPSACRWVVEEFAIALGYDVGLDVADTGGWPGLPPPPPRRGGPPPLPDPLPRPDPPPHSAPIPVPVAAAVLPLVSPGSARVPMVPTVRADGAFPTAQLSPAGTAARASQTTQDVVGPGTAGTTPASTARGGPSPVTPSPVTPTPVGPSTRRGRSLRSAIIVVAVLIVVVAGGAAAIVLTRPSHTAGTKAPPTSTLTDPAAQGNHAAQTIAQDLASSATARSQVAAATSGLSACRVASAAALQMTDAAIATRERIIAQLSILNVNGLANGLTVQADLIQALNASLSADRSFAAWMTDVVNGRSCSAFAGDPNWAAANAASSKATQTKSTFLDHWNPLARTYSLPTYSQSQL